MNDHLEFKNATIDFHFNVNFQQVDAEFLVWITF